MDRISKFQRNSLQPAGQGNLHDKCHHNIDKDHTCKLTHKHPSCDNPYTYAEQAGGHIKLDLDRTRLHKEAAQWDRDIRRPRKTRRDSFVKGKSRPDSRKRHRKSECSSLYKENYRELWNIR